VGRSKAVLDLGSVASTAARYSELFRGMPKRHVASEESCLPGGDGFRAGKMNGAVPAKRLFFSQIAGVLQQGPGHHG
jgi:hypothetical protein